MKKLLRPFCFSILTAVAVPTWAAAQTTQRASVSSSGGQSGFTCQVSDISDNGRIVAFETSGDQLVPGDTNFVNDIFVHDFDTGETKRVSVSSAGGQSNAASSQPSLSADGRHVAFTSYASNLVANDMNNDADIFLHDRQTGTTTRVSLSSSGEEAEAHCLSPVLSPNARYVTFITASPNFNSIGTTQWEVYLRDLQTGITDHVSVGMGGQPADASADAPSLSDDGRFVVFSSIASNLVPGDTNGAQDVFVRDRLAGTTVRVSVDPSGNQTGAPGASCLGARITNDGRYVVFWSGAGNIVPGDDNGSHDVFMRDLQEETTVRLSEGPDGEQGTFPSRHPFMTPDGRYVAFESWAQNITPGDTAFYHDIILQDLWSGVTRRVSLDTAGLDPNGHSYKPALSKNGRWVVFESSASDLIADDTNGWQDIFRYGPMLRDPLVDVDLNGADGPVTLPLGVPANITIAFDAGDHTGTHFDWWLWAEAPNGTTFWMLANMSWIASPVPISTYQGGTISFPHVPIISGATLPAGTYRIHFALDAPDGVLNETYRDTVEFTIQ